MTQPTRQSSLNVLPLKERMKVPRQHMLEQPPPLRACNFTEVNLGYSEELARREALRCLECAKPRMHERLSGGRQGQRLRAVDRGRRLHGRGR